MLIHTYREVPHPRAFSVRVRDDNHGSELRDLTKRRQTDRLIPAVTQIAPLWIAVFDQRDFLLPPPVFELFLAADGLHHGAVALKIDNFGYVVLRCEPTKRMRFVLARTRVSMWLVIPK